MFDSLTDLKAFLLPSSIRQDTDFDVAIGWIGKGVASAFNSYCNREFLRVVDAQMIFSADRHHVIAERYPVESVTRIEVKTTEAGGWIEEIDPVELIHPTSGRIQFDGALGDWDELGRITYTGGYWVDESEDNSGALPDGATPMPDDLVLAWLQQCQDVWTRKDKLGSGFFTDQRVIAASLLQGGLLPTVDDILQSKRRYQIT